MNSLLALASAHKVAATAVVAAVVVGGVIAVSGGATTATVSKVVDGDTVDVAYDGATHRVRLLNVDTPETVDPEQPVQCLGPEATDYLRGRLPAGTEVRLERDEEEVDRYGRELAAVFLDDELINASIAEAGLGIAIAVGDNTEFWEPVRAAELRARAANRGLYSTSTACTVPSQVAQVQSATADALSQAPATSAGLDEIDGYADELLAAAATARSVTLLLNGAKDVFPLAAHSAVEISAFESTVGAADAQVHSAAMRNESARTAEVGRLAAKEAAELAARKAAEEAARKAAEEAARTAAEEESRKAAEDAAREDAVRQASERAAAARAAAAAPARQSSSAAPQISSSSGSSSSSGGSGYTGCRSYAPGGKTWSPIDC
jgi:micrococcal nuclease